MNEARQIVWAGEALTLPNRAAELAEIPKRELALRRCGQRGEEAPVPEVVFPGCKTQRGLDARQFSDYEKPLAPRHQPAAAEGASAFRRDGELLAQPRDALS